MDTNQAIQIVLDELQKRKKLTNSQMLDFLDGDEKLLRGVRETLILDGLAQDKDGVGLILRETASSDTSSDCGKPKLFLSYGRKDAKDLADRLAADLGTRGFAVWQDTTKITSGASWQHEITDGLRSAQIVIALLSPHAVRTTADPNNPDGVDSVCLGEIAYALFQPPSKPVVPVMAATCEPPLAIFHLDYVDLTRWRDSEDQYRTGLEKLMKAIESALRGEKRYRSWHHQLKPWDFAAFLHEKRRDFTGREWLFEEIDAWRASTKHERALLITGDPGTGKSAIVAELVHRNPGGQVIAYHCCQADTPATLEPWRFVRSIAAMIASRLPEYAAQLEDPSVQEMLSEENCRQDPAGALERAVFAPLETLAAPKEGVRYLLVDALDEALTLGRGLTIVQLLASRLNRLPGWLRIVVTTRREQEVLNRLRGLRAQELDAQDPRNQADVGDYIRRRLDSPTLGSALIHTGVSKAAVSDALRNKSEGNFLYVRQALDGLESGTYSLADLESLPAGLYGLYDEFFRRQFGEHGENYDEPKRVLEVIVAAREPLTAEELAKAAELHSRRELPRVLNQLASFVPARADGSRRTTYAAFHKSIVDWLTAEELLGATFHVLPENGHHRLAAWIQAEFSQGAGAMSPYALSHAAHHFAEAGSWESLERLLTDLFYLERRSEAGQLFELVLDYATAVAAMPRQRPQRRILGLLNEALRRDIHFISEHAQGYPQGLFQCLWNTGWWYDSPDTAKHYEPPNGGWSAEGPFWDQPGPKLYKLLEQWRAERERAEPGFFWLRMQRPPRVHLGGSLQGVLMGHKGCVNAVVFSPDGTQIASGSQDNTIRVWDAGSGAELAVFEGHKNAVHDVCYTPDGARIASASNDNSIRVWDAADGRELAVLKGHENCVRTVCFSADAKQIASGSNDKTVRLWDVLSGVERIVWEGHTSGVYCVFFSPDGRQLISLEGALENWIRTFDVEGSREIRQVRGPEGFVQCAACSPDRACIAFGLMDNTLRVWDIKTGQETGVLRGHEDSVTSICFAPDGSRIASGSADQSVRVWDAAKGIQLRQFKGTRLPGLGAYGERIVFGSCQCQVSGSGF